jgi:DNA repair protein RadC
MQTNRRPAAEVKSEEPADYYVHNSGMIGTEDQIIAKALDILRERLYSAGAVLDNPSAVRNLLTLHLAEYEYEVFGCLFLDSQNHLIEMEDMFRGTLLQTSVYPREVVKKALAVNAGAVILYHNHPSGNPEPSRADEALTSSLRTTLAVVDVKVLDHFIVAGTKITSFAERGLL